MVSLQMGKNFIYIKDEDFVSEFDQIRDILSEKHSIILEETAIIVISSRRSEVTKVSPSIKNSSLNRPANKNIQAVSSGSSSSLKRNAKNM